MAESENVIKEGKASIFLSEKIFYNPVQEFNRDMSVAALTVFGEDYKNYVSEKPQKRRYYERSKTEEPKEDEPKQEGINVVEALAATGLRSVRYALEVPNIAKIYANDCSMRAVETMIRNIKENGVEHLVNAENHDAVWLMQKLSFENKEIHVVDLDPYGCPSRFLDSAVNCVAEGGMMMLTCTDMAVLAGNTPESCYIKYGSISLRSCACHEMALRIALQSVATLCGKYGKYIVPMLSMSADFYIRIFIKVFSSQQKSKLTSSNISLLYQCVGCEMKTLHPLCTVEEKPGGNRLFNIPRGPPISDTCVHCGFKHKVGGPIWSGKLHDEEFVDKMLTVAKRENLATHKRMIGMLTLIKEELNDVPLYYTSDSLCAKLHCETIPLVDIRSALLNAGYRVSSSHCNSNAIKTNAPQTFIWDMMRCWVKTHPISKKRLNENKVINTILAKEPEYEINFQFCKGAVPRSAAAGVLRFQQNPFPNWGPGARSKSKIFNDSVTKKERNQNKKKRLKAELQVDEKPPDNEGKVDSNDGQN